MMKLRVGHSNPYINHGRSYSKNRKYNEQAKEFGEEENDNEVVR